MNLQTIEYKENTEYEWNIVGKGIISLKSFDLLLRMVFECFENKKFEKI